MFDSGHTTAPCAARPAACSERAWWPLVRKAAEVLGKYFFFFLLFDLCATVATHLVTTAFQSLGLDDSTQLDNFIATCVVQQLWSHPDGANSNATATAIESPAAGQDTCPLLGLDGFASLHGLVVLARAVWSLACWCAVFSLLNFVGTFKAKAVSCIVSKNWRQRVHRQHIGQQFSFSRSAHYLLLGLPGKATDWLQEFHTLLLEELKLRALTLLAWHVLLRLLPALPRSTQLRLHQPIVLVHQLSWRGALAGLSVLAKTKLLAKQRRLRQRIIARANAQFALSSSPICAAVSGPVPVAGGRQPGPVSPFALVEQPQGLSVARELSGTSRAGSAGVLFTPLCRSARQPLLRTVAAWLAGLLAPQQQQCAPHSPVDVAGQACAPAEAACAPLLRAKSSSMSLSWAVLPRRHASLRDACCAARDAAAGTPAAAQQQQQPVGRLSSPASITAAAISSAVGFAPDHAAGPDGELVIIPALYFLHYATRLMVAVVEQLVPYQSPLLWLSLPGLAKYLVLFVPLNAGLLLHVAATLLWQESDRKGE